MKYYAFQQTLELEHAIFTGKVTNEGVEKRKFIPEITVRCIAQCINHE